MIAEFKNPHVHPAEEPSSSAENTQEIPLEKLPVRYVELSPVEEFAVRDGKTEFLPESLIAFMCYHHQGYAECTLNGIKIHKMELVGKLHAKAGRRYKHPDSITCNDISKGEKKRVMYVFNPERPDFIHLMHPKTGKYIETLPAENMPGFLDLKAKKKEMANNKRVIRRVADALQDRHQNESHEACDQAAKDAAASLVAASVLNLPIGSRPGPASKTRTPADDVVEAGDRMGLAQEDFRRHQRDADAAILTPRNRPEPVTEEVSDPFANL